MKLLVLGALAACGSDPVHHLPDGPLFASDGPVTHSETWTGRSDSAGTVVMNGNNTISFSYPPQNGNAAHTDHYLVTGWFVGTDSIFLKLQGPKQVITQQDFDDINANRIYDKTFVRRR